MCVFAFMGVRNEAAFAQTAGLFWTMKRFKKEHFFRF